MTRGISGSDGGNHISYSDSTIYKAKGERPQIDGVSIWDNDKLTETTTYENGKKVAYTKSLSRKEHVIQSGDEVRTRELVNERYDAEGNVIKTTVETKRDGNIVETTTYENGRKVSYTKEEETTYHVPQAGDETYRRLLASERYDAEGNVINTTVETKRDGNIIETTTYENGRKVSYTKEEETTYHVTKGGDDTYRKLLASERYDAEGNVINTTTDTKVTNLHVKKAK